MSTLPSPQPPVHANLPTLRTARLRLRPWRPQDREPFAALNSDPLVMEHFPGLLTREQSDAFADRIEAQFAELGYGAWAVEAPGVAPFIGFVGLAAPRFEAFFTPCVEVGWRLAREHWHQGYATEAARAAVRYGFDVQGLQEIVSFTVKNNRASRRVMEKLGMSYDCEFDHPTLPKGHPLERHVLYRLAPGAHDRFAGATDAS